jgi:hypothetical protein
MLLIGAIILFISFIFLIKGMSSSEPAKIKKIYKYTLIIIGLILITFLFRFGMPLIALLLGAIMATVSNIGRIISLLNTVQFIKNYFPQKIEQMSVKEAREILNIQEGASEQEINDAYKSLMKKNHPDTGGSNYFANLLNVAKNTLLKK